MSPSALAVLLADPRFVLAMSLTVETAIRNLLAKYDEMTEEELDVFIAQKEKEKVDHDAWLDQHLGR